MLVKLDRASVVVVIVESPDSSELEVVVRLEDIVSEEFSSEVVTRVETSKEIVVRVETLLHVPVVSLERLLVKVSSPVELTVDMIIDSVLSDEIVGLVESERSMAEILEMVVLRKEVVLTGSSTGEDEDSVVSSRVVDLDISPSVVVDDTEKMESAGDEVALCMLELLVDVKDVENELERSQTVLPSDENDES